MISLKRAIEDQSDELFHRTLEAYRLTLGSVAEAGGRAYPPSEGALRDSLLQLQKGLVQEAAPESIAETSERARNELREWGEQAHRYYEEKTGEVKEVLLIVAGLASHLTDRDQRNTAGFSQLTQHLDAAAKLGDISEIRRSVLQSVQGLRQQMARMEREGQETVNNLRTQVAIYQTRLEEAERQASQDPLTGLFNRRAIEAMLNRRHLECRPFNVIMLDLNGFKSVNDTLGHLAGDDLLTQFGQELKGALRTSDVVGRWGGDEFVALVDGNFQDAEARAKRIEDWVNGEYTLHGSTVTISAAAGIATWQPGESIQSVIERADAAMYAHKPRR
jgi:diguanylate cyclase (GGDEF)-like protein